MTTTSSAMPASHQSRCSATSTDVPDAFALATYERRSMIAAISRLLVGSSSTRFVGRAAQTLANAIRCFSPPESEKMFRSARWRMPRSSMVSATRSRISPSGVEQLSNAKATSPVESTLKNCVRGFWNTLPTESATSQLRICAQSRPSITTRPESAPGKNVGASPLASRVSVVLPHPEGPHTSTHEPCGTARSICDTPAARSGTVRA